MIESDYCMKKIKFLKLLFTFVLCFIIIDNVHAAYFTCNAFGSEVFIDEQIAYIFKYIIIILQIAVPVLLVVLGSIDLIKGISSQKEDEIKSGQKVFIKRLISAALVFFVIAIVKLIIGIAASGNSDSIFQCVNYFIKGPDYSES